MRHAALLAWQGRGRPKAWQCGKKAFLGWSLQLPPGLLAPEKPQEEVYALKPGLRRGGAPWPPPSHLVGSSLAASDARHQLPPPFLQVYINAQGRAFHGQRGWLEYCKETGRDPGSRGGGGGGGGGKRKRKGGSGGGGRRKARRK